MIGIGEALTLLLGGGADAIARVRFQGREWLAIGDLFGATNMGMAIATEEAYLNFEVSYAHAHTNGRVSRFGEVIGSTEDIEILGPWTP